jgi:hypothetical protein
MVWQGGTADRKTTVTPETVGLLVEKCGAAFRSRYVVCLQARGDIRYLTCVFSSFFPFTQCNRRSTVPPRTLHHLWALLTRFASPLLKACAFSLAS